MKDFKFIIVLTILLMAFISVGSAFAADLSIGDTQNIAINDIDTQNIAINDIDTQNIAINDIDTQNIVINDIDTDMVVNDNLGLEIDENSNGLGALSEVYVASNGNDEADGSKDHPFKTLEHALDMVADNGVINFLGTFTYTGPTEWYPMEETKTVTVMGNGVTLTKGLSVSDCKLTIRDVNFVNKGLWLYESYGDVINCTFINCSADDIGYGGGIAASYDCNVTNCTFINCNGWYRGGAIDACFCDFTLIVTGSTFINCSADMGGAIYSGGTISVINCIFDNNKGGKGNCITLNSKHYTINSNFFGTANITDEEFENLNYVCFDDVNPDCNERVILKIVYNGDKFTLKFVYRNGTDVSSSMPEYTAMVSFNDENPIMVKVGEEQSIIGSKPVTIKAYSPNSNTLLDEITVSNGDKLTPKNQTNNDDNNTADVKSKDLSGIASTNNDLTTMPATGNPILLLLIALSTVCIGSIRRKF